MWELEDFIPRFDAWVELEHPDAPLQLVVLAWIVSRLSTPYKGVSRQAGFDNLWFGSIPDSYEGDHVVTCAYFILESEHVVVCSSIATLRTPI